MTIRDDLRALKKERILEEAERLFYERGFHGTSLDAIAEALEMTKPFVYGAFEKKTDILFDIYLRIVTRSLEAIEEARASEGSSSDRLCRFAQLLTEVTISNQAGVAIFFREELSLPQENLAVLNELKGKIDDGIAALLSDGVASGEFAVHDVRTAALAIGGMISWVYTWYRPSGRLEPAQIAEHMASYALRIAAAKVSA